MLAIPMKNEFLIYYDKIGNKAAPPYDDIEISTILTTAQTRVFKRLSNKDGNKYQEGFDSTDIRRTQLNNLISTVHIPAGTLTGTYISTNTATYTTSAVTDRLGGSNGLKITTNSLLALNPSDILTLPLTRGLYVGQKITLSSAAVVTILEISTDDTIIISGANTGITSFTGNLGVSKNQTPAHLNALSVKSRSRSKGIIFDLPLNYYSAIEESVLTDDFADMYIRVKPITHDYYMANINFPHKTVDKYLAWRLNIGENNVGNGLEDDSLQSTVRHFAPTNKRFEVITNGSLIYDYFLRYYRFPKAIVVDEEYPLNCISSELDDSLHHMIIDEAVKIAVGVTQQNEYEVKSAEVQTSD